MKSRFFVVFSRTVLAQPKLYQRQAYAIKKCNQCHSYEMKDFHLEQDASQFYQDKLNEIKANQGPKSFKLLTDNLELKTVGEKKQKKGKVSSQKAAPFALNPLQKQERLKELNQILVTNHVFNRANFKHSEAQVDPSLNYEGEFDGSCIGNPGESGIGYCIKAIPSELTVISRAEYIGRRTNNKAEMIALVLMLGDAYCNGISRLKVFGDSQLVINFMTGSYSVKAPHLVEYVQAAKTLSSRFQSIYFQHIGRTFNYRADQLAREGVKKQGKG